MIVLVELLLENALEFKRCIDAISVLIDEAEFIVSENGLSLKATDPSQISLIDFEFPKKAFKSMEVEKETRIGLDLNYLSQIVSRAKSSDKLKLSLGEKSNKLLVEFSGDSERSFSIPLLDLSSTDLPNPKIDFESEITLKADVLQDGLKDASLISTHITLSANEKEFVLKAMSSKGELIHNVSKKDKALIELVSKKDCSAMFPLDYLQDMIKNAAPQSHIKLFLKSSAPLKVSYNIGEASLTYFLAPRIENP